MNGQGVGGFVRLQFYGECQNFCVWGVFLSSPFATTMMRVGAVGNRVLGGFPSPGGRVLCVHGDGSVHARLHSTPGVS
jgi:hypothetical protein